MHIISKKILREFWVLHPAAEAPLRLWHSRVHQLHVMDFNQLKANWPSADYVPPYTVFNIAGNHYRLIAHVHYQSNRVYIHTVLTHNDYDRWGRQNRKRGHP